MKGLTHFSAFVLTALALTLLSVANPDQGQDDKDRNMHKIPTMLLNVERTDEKQDPRYEGEMTLNCLVGVALESQN